MYAISVFPILVQVLPYQFVRSFFSAGLSVRLAKANGFSCPSNLLLYMFSRGILSLSIFYCLADVLSRLPLQNSEKEVDNEEPIHVFHVEQIENLPVSNKEIQIETRKDKTLALVHDFVLNGWPQAYKNGELAPYYARRDELTVSQGC
jgi:hypothetical protein